jgi:hypothetical protein
MRSRGYDRARLFTPSGHARARRFYEGRGWRAVDERFHPDLALDLTEYRLTSDAYTGRLASDSQR